MKYIIFTLLLFFSAFRLNAQGICDSIISIDPIQPLCMGTGYTYLNTSHPGGVFSGSGVSPNSYYLDAETMSDGIYTVTYTITGPGGCTVSTSRDFEVRFAPEFFSSVSGKIDCSDPNSEVTITAGLVGDYFGAHWEGPSLLSEYGNSATTKIAGSYKFIAYSANPNQCPAYAFQEVKFKNNTVSIKIEDCTDCGGWAQKIRIADAPPDWQISISTPNNHGYYSPADASGCFAAISETGVWTATATNQENGCKSTDTQYLNTEYNKPSVSAGSNVGIGCNWAGSFLAAMNPSSGPLFNYFWTTPSGSTEPATYGGLLKATEPGKYVLHGVNTFTGCETTDTAIASVVPTPVKSTIAIICNGESLNGHTQSGTYVDTLLQPNGCIKVEITKLIVVPPLQDFADVNPDDGQMSGSIQHFITQGWPPYSYEWSTGETSDMLSNLSAGTYEVTVTDGNDCQYLRTFEVPFNRPGKSIATQREAQDFTLGKLYPNPGQSGQTQYALELRSASALEADLMLHDVLGRNLFTRPVQIQEGKNVFTFSENLPAGTYTVFLKGDFGTKAVSKLVVAGGN